VDNRDSDFILDLRFFNSLLAVSLRTIVTGAAFVSAANVTWILAKSLSFRFSLAY
jgi:hypothetical protein